MTLISFNKINERKKITAISIICLLIIIGVAYLIIWPTLNDIKQLRANIITQKIDLEKKIVREKNMNILSEKLKKIEPQLKKFNQIFINQNRELEFITTIEGIAGKNQITQKINLNPASAQNEQIYKKIPLTLDAQGKFQNLMKYLTNLETLNYYINIKSLEITAGQNVGAVFQRTKTNNAKQSTDNINIKILADTHWK